MGNGRLPVSRLEHVGHAGKDYCARKAIRKGTRGDGTIGSASASGFSKLEQPASRMEREASRKSRVKKEARGASEPELEVQRRECEEESTVYAGAGIASSARGFEREREISKGRREVVGFDW